MSEHTPTTAESGQTPSAAGYAQLRAELDEMKDRLARLEPIAAYGDRIAATVLAFAMRTEEVLAEIATALKAVAANTDTVSDRVAMARHEVAGLKAVRSPTIEQIPADQVPAPTLEAAGR